MDTRIISPTFKSVLFFFIFLKNSSPNDNKELHPQTSNYFFFGIIKTLLKKQKTNKEKSKHESIN